MMPIRSPIRWIVCCCLVLWLTGGSLWAQPFGGPQTLWGDVEEEVEQTGVTSIEVIASLLAGLVLIWLLVLYQAWLKLRLLNLPDGAVEEVYQFEDVLEATESGVAAVTWVTYLSAPVGILLILLGRGQMVAGYPLSVLSAALTLAILVTGLATLLMIHRLRLRWSRDSVRFVGR